MQVATQGGDILGYLVDVDVNENWEIVEIRLSGLRAVKIDPRHAVFGKDTVLVTDDDVKVRSTGNRRPGFMESVLGRNTILSVSEALSRKEGSVNKGKKTGGKQKRKSGKRKKSGDPIRKIAKSRAKQSRGGGGKKKKGSGSGDKKKSNQ